MDIDRLSVEERDRCVCEGLCFYCQKPNHVASECRHKKRSGTPSTGRRPQTTGRNNPQSSFKRQSPQQVRAVTESPPKDKSTETAAPSPPGETVDNKERIKRVNALLQGLNDDEKDEIVTISLSSHVTSLLFLALSRLLQQ